MILLSRIGGAALVAVWFTAAIFGIASLHRYSGTPAPVGRSQVRWPVSSQIKPSPRKATFVLFLHPHCPCSRASVAVMNEIVTQFPSAAEYHAVFVRPTGVNDDWAETDLFRKCKSMVGLVTSIDEDGSEAKKFGAKASGQTYIYDADHRLAFSGGITPGRGMEGKGEERTMVESALSKKLSSPLHSPTFGCALI